MAFNINQYLHLSNKRSMAIDQAKENCLKLKNFMTFGVDSFVDRLPSFTTSILSMPQGSQSSYDIKNIILSEELNDYQFIERMMNLFRELSEAYRDIFIMVYIQGKSLSSFHRSDIYKIIHRGLLKIAIADATINYTGSDELDYQNLKLEKVTHDKNITKYMKEKLKSLRYLKYSHMILLSVDSNGFLQISNIKLKESEYDTFQTVVFWINELHTFQPSSGLSPKDALIKFIMDPNWKYLDTTDRNNLKRGLLALAYLDTDINYSWQEFEYDAKNFTRCDSFIRDVKHLQFRLKL